MRVAGNWGRRFDLGVICEKTGIAITGETVLLSAQGRRGSYYTQASSSPASCQLLSDGLHFFFAQPPPLPLAVARQELTHTTAARFATPILADRTSTPSGGRFFEGDRVDGIGAQIFYGFIANEVWRALVVGQNFLETFELGRGLWHGRSDMRGRLSRDCGHS